MGVAVTVLSCLSKLEAQTAVTMLGIGLACGGATLLEKQWAGDGSHEDCDHPRAEP